METHTAKGIIAIGKIAFEEMIIVKGLMDKTRVSDLRLTLKVESSERAAPIKTV